MPSHAVGASSCSGRTPAMAAEPGVRLIPRSTIGLQLYSVREHFKSDLEGTIARVAALGFDGKWAIHPSQIPIAHEVFSPTEAEVADAREAIARAIDRIRRRPKEFKQQTELSLRRLLPEQAVAGQSLLWRVLDTIERRMSNAADIMLPALRRALHGFTKRADIIIRQLSYLHSQSNNDLLSLCQTLRALPEAERTQRLQNAGQAMAAMKLQLVDPAQIKLQERRSAQTLQTAVADDQPLDPEAQRELLIQQLLDQAFAMDNQSLRSYVLGALRQGECISTRQLPVANARDLLALAHVIEVAAANNLGSEHIFSVEPTGRTHSTEYYQKLDEFTIELKTLS